MACYVVLAPDHIRGIYESWPQCEAVVRGVGGAIYRKAADRQLAERLLRGEGRKLEPGTYAFIDGNADGGIGVVLVHRRENGSTVTKEVSVTVTEAAPSLASEIARLRNPLAELVALAVAFRTVKAGVSLSVIHDYEGTGAWMNGRWRARDPVIADVVTGCRTLVSGCQLSVIYRHENGHQSAAGGDEFAQYNARADALATAATK